LDNGTAILFARFTPQAFKASTANATQRIQFPITSALNFRMFFGLQHLHDQPPRDLRQQFITLVDPYIREGFQASMPAGKLTVLNNWSRSYYSKEGHLESILKFNKPIKAQPTQNEWNQIKRESFDYFSHLPRVTPLSAIDKGSFDRVQYHQSTSAGLGYTYNPGPNPTHKGPPDGPNHKRAKGIASKIVHECESHMSDNSLKSWLKLVPDDSTPDIAFTRTQLVELPDTKIRNVFGECFHYVILEGLFACPLLQMFMSNDTFYFIGKDPVKGVPDLINSMSPKDEAYYLSLDWSQFDASVQPYEIELAFDLLESILDFPDETTRAVYKYVARLFMKRKLVSPDGRVFMRFSGVPSGSYFTHLIDSIINWIRIRFLLLLERINYGTLVTHGDDCFVELLSSFDSLSDLADFARSLGWYVKIEKTQLFKERSRITYLGRSIHYGQNYRDIDRCLRLMYYPEYPVTDPQISIARLKAIDEDSGYSIPFITNVYHYLKTKYGDNGIELPKQFRRHAPTANLNISI
jgi:hypothetical protein